MIHYNTVVVAAVVAVVAVVVVAVAVAASTNLYSTFSDYNSSF